MALCMPGCVYSIAESHNFIVGRSSYCDTSLAVDDKNTCSSIMDC